MRGGRPREERRTANGSFVLYCTEHREKTPSLWVWKDGGFLCHGCHYRGHVEDDPQILQKVVRLKERYEQSLWLFPEDAPKPR